MSNIYIQEPPTSGKVLLTTNIGEYEIELFAKETPKACRNFVQLCMEGYYNGTIFHRVLKGFIAQGGDPSGTGVGGESIYGEPFKDEFHTRLRFVRRGLVAMANAGKDDNGSQFFFTLGMCPELQNKHTIFGKVAGDTLYNLGKFDDLLVDINDKPHYPPKITKTTVLVNPFPDIEPRVDSRKRDAKEKKHLPKEKGVKSFQLLSFGDEAEEDEEEILAVEHEFKGSKSSHDLLTDDPKLSSLPAVDLVPYEKNSDDEAEKEAVKERIRNKLKKEAATKPNSIDDAGSDDELTPDAKKRILDLKEQVRQLKKELRGDKRKPTEEDVKEEQITNPVIAEFKNNQDAYRKKKSEIKSKDSGREAQTLAMLEKFQSKLQTAIENTDEAQPMNEEDSDTEAGWLSHRLRFEDADPVLAKDASMRGSESFSIYDPRNPMNKRRRDEAKDKQEKKIRN